MNKQRNEIYQIFLKNKSVKIDSREVKKGDIFFTLSGENFNGNRFAQSALESGADLVIMDDQEVFRQLREQYLERMILVDDSLKSLQNLAKKYRQELKIPFLGITGSNGKTTTKELVREVLLEKYNVLATVGNLNNHIGVPLTILSIKSEHNFAVIEMGANHVGEIGELCEIAEPNFGIITNIGLAHLGEFGGLENIFITKKHLYDAVLKNNGTIFWNDEDENLQNASVDFPEDKKISFAEAGKADDGKLLTVNILTDTIQTWLVGDYNIPNITAAYTIGKYFDIPDENIKKALENYRPKNNRSQIEKTKKGNEVIWDCYNANPTSMQLAIESFSTSGDDKENIYILGQMAELGKYSETEHKKILEILKEKEGKKILIGKEFMNLKNQFSNFSYFQDVVGLEQYIEKNSIENSSVLVKGSNSIKLSKLQELKII